MKKCYFETYRFSEDLDFTLINSNHINVDFLISSITAVSDWIYEQSGIELIKETLRFDIYDNPRGKPSVQGRIGYRGPLQFGGDPPKVKLDLTNDEVLVLNPVIRDVHHPYSDKPDDGFKILSYCFEEVFAEKLRALGERERPRDLYDVIHLFRREGLDPDRTLIMDTLEKKCQFKNVDIPSIDSLNQQPGRDELEADWGHMLAHQLPILPPFDQFWADLEKVFDWLLQKIEKTVLHRIPSGGGQIDYSRESMEIIQSWDTTAPLEVIRFAAANRLCIDLKYNGTHRIIEPYSFRRSKAGNILLHAVRHQNMQPRAYRIDRIQGASVTQQTFDPIYTIELTEGMGISDRT